VFDVHDPTLQGVSSDLHDASVVHSTQFDALSQIGVDPLHMTSPTQSVLHVPSVQVWEPGWQELVPHARTTSSSIFPSQSLSRLSHCSGTGVQALMLPPAPEPAMLCVVFMPPAPKPAVLCIMSVPPPPEPAMLWIIMVFMPLVPPPSAAGVVPAALCATVVEPPLPLAGTFPGDVAGDDGLTPLPPLDLPAALPVAAVPAPAVDPELPLTVTWEEPAS
jgi:hypothetical protein